MTPRFRPSRVLCHLCKRHATRNCAICLRPVCRKHHRSGVCHACLYGG
jgi:hypothetical protein